MLDKNGLNIKYKMYNEKKAFLVKKGYNITFVTVYL